MCAALIYWPGFIREITGGVIRGEAQSPVCEELGKSSVGLCRIYLHPKCFFELLKEIFFSWLKPKQKKSSEVSAWKCESFVSF